MSTVRMLPVSDMYNTYAISDWWVQYVYYQWLIRTVRILPVSDEYSMYATRKWYVQYVCYQWLIRTVRILSVTAARVQHVYYESLLIRYSYLLADWLVELIILY